MLRLLKIEYYKIKGNKSFWIFGLLFAILFPFLMLGIPSMLEADMGNGKRISFFQPISYKQCWYTSSYVAGWFVIFMLSLIVIYNMANEYTYRTVRQNVIDGFSKMDFIKSKLLTILTLSVFITFIVFITGAILGLYFEGRADGQVTSFQDMVASEMNPLLNQSRDFGNFTEGIGFIFMFFIQTLAYFSWAFLISILIKRAGVANMIFGVSILTELIIYSQIYNVSIAKFLPFRAISSLVKNPSGSSFISGFDINYTFSDVYIVLLYIGIFTGSAIFLFKKQDL